MPFMPPQEDQSGPFGGAPGSTLQSVPQPPPDLPLEQPQTQQQPDPLDQIKQSLAQRYQQLQPTPASGGPVRQLLQNFFADTGKFFMGDMTARKQEQTLRDLTTVSNVQGMDQLRKAQASQYEMVDVPLPDGTTGQLPKKFLGQWTAAQQRSSTSENVAKINADAKTNIAQNSLDSKETLANQANQTKRDIAEAANVTRMKIMQRTLAQKAALAGNGAATSQRLNKADLAVNIQQNVNDMKQLIDAEPELFGKIAGRYTSIQQMIGSDDPHISVIGIAAHNAALANNSIHGIRSAEGAKTTEQAILNGFKNGPQATKATMDEMARSASTFIGAAKLGKSAPNAPGKVENWVRVNGKLVKQ